MRRKILLPWLIAIAAVLQLAAQSASTAPAAPAKTAAAKPATPAPVDKAYLQSIWDGWAAADIDKQAQFYVAGPGHLFYDVAPLKYNSWEEYKAGVAPSLKDSPKVTYTLNDDLQIHPAREMPRGLTGTLRDGGDVAAGEKADSDVALDRGTGTAGWPLGDQHEHVSVPPEPPQP